MAPPRVPLASISGNQTPRRQLTAYERGKIEGAFAAGATPAQIAKQFNTPDSTVRDTIKHLVIRAHGNVEKRTGRPKQITPREERKLIRQARITPKASYI
jgi:IS30 family transposase